MNNLAQPVGNVKRMKHPVSAPVRPAVALDIAASIRSATELADELHAAFPMLAGRLNSRVMRRDALNVRVVVAVDLAVDHNEIRAFVLGYAQRSAATVAFLPRNGGWDRAEVARG
jgi:hypothetical protein